MSKRFHGDGAREDVAELDAMIAALESRPPRAPASASDVAELAKMVRHLRVLIDDLFAEVER